MADSPKIYRYYIFFGLLLAGVIAALGYTISRASDAKTDAQTSAKVLEISNKLDQYQTKNSQLPATLDDAGVNNIPGTISYNKTGAGQYKICVSYKDASAVSINPTNLFLSAVFKQSLNNNSSFQAHDLVGLTYVHKAGQTCQTLKSNSQTLSTLVNQALANTSGLAANTNKASNQTDSSNSLITAKCGQNGAAYELSDQTTIQSVDSGQGVITLSTSNAKLTDKNDVPVKSLASIKYDAVTSVYGASCKKTTIDSVAALKPGAAITIYLYTHDSTYADQIEL